MDAACRAQYGERPIVAAPTGANDADTWNSYQT